MNRLWVRLSISFGLFVVFSITAMIVVVNVLVRINGQSMVSDIAQIPDGPIDQLKAYYDRHHSWQGVDSFLAGAESAISVMTVSDFHLSLTSADGQAVYYADVGDGAPLPDWVSRNGRLLSTVPIVTGDTVRGYISVVETPSDISGQQQRIWELFQRYLLLLITIGGGGGILFGIISSRYMTRPLNQLAEAAQAIGAHDLRRRVAVRGSQEVVAVAQAFNNMAEALERAERLRRNLVADVAHELRTPLSVLRGSLRAILDNVYSLDKAEVARLYDQTRVLSRLVDDLQDLTLAEAQQLRLNIQPLDFAALIQDVVQTFGPLAESEGVSFEVKTAAAMPFVNADAVRMTQVLHNLLMNALRHTPAGGKISLCADNEGGAVELVVRDTGAGIPPDHLPHVFDRFYRADHGTNRQVSGGAGLGLTIARALVETHGGQITAASDGIAGHGTAFTIRIPAA